ncbi:MAG TPA: signal peptidase II [Solirubrobacterales bacterium]
MSGDGARAWRLGGALCGLVIVLDQATKALAEANLAPGEEVELLGPVGLTLSHNSGVAFGLASGSGEALVLLGVVALVGIVGFLFAREPDRPGLWIATGLLAGGAFGNLIDRVLEGEVTDYIDVLSWPAFNIADVAITVGIVLFALIYLRNE